MAWTYQRKRIHREIPGNAIEVDYVAAFLDPSEQLDPDEIRFSEELQSYMMNVVPLWYTVKDFITMELEPKLK